MTKNITETAYETMKKQKELFFDESYLKSKPFNDIIFDIFESFAPRYIASILMFQIVSEVAIFIRQSPEIYENYSKNDKKNLKVFLKNMQYITCHINQVNKIVLNIGKLIKKHKALNLNKTQ